MKSYKEDKLKTAKADICFISKGFHNWKDALTKFKTQNSSDCHRDATLTTVELPGKFKDML